MGAALVACDNADDPQNPQSYTIVFDTNGGSIVSEQGVTGGDKIIEPGDPTKFGYEFDGWYTDEECTQIWTFETDTVTGNLTLYAKWKDKSATANTYFDFGLSNGAYSIKVKMGRPCPRTSYCRPSTRAKARNGYRRRRVRGTDRAQKRQDTEQRQVNRRARLPQLRKPRNRARRGQRGEHRRHGVRRH